MATPVASTSQPAQLPALQGPHTHDETKGKKPKEKKDKITSSTAYPLEVCALFIEPCLQAEYRVAATCTSILRSPHQNIRKAKG
jgi:hypothetical protein